MSSARKNNASVIVGGVEVGKMPATENEIRRVRMAVAHKVLGAEYGSVLGVMRIRGELTESEYEAGRWAQRTRDTYLKAIAARGVKSQDFTGVGKGSDVDPDSQAASGMNERDRKAVEAHELMSRIIAISGKAAASLFDRYVFVTDTDALGLFPSPIERAVVKDICRSIRVYREAAWRNKVRASRA